MIKRKEMRILFSSFLHSRLRDHLDHPPILLINKRTRLASKFMALRNDRLYLGIMAITTGMNFNFHRKDTNKSIEPRRDHQNEPQQQGSYMPQSRSLERTNKYQY
jgi:hypothetical protein